MNIIPLNIQRFASGEFELPGYVGNYNVTLQGKITWSSTAGSSTENKSSVTANLYVRKLNASSATTAKDWSGYISINGSTSSFSSLSSSITVSSSWVFVKSYTIDVAHESNGTKSIYIGGKIKGATGTSIASYYSEGGATVTLDTIPRADSIGNASLTLGTAGTISWSTNSSSFTHTLRYIRNGNSVNIGTGLGTSASYTAPYDIANDITNSTSGNYTLYLDTYSGSTLIGTSQAVITFNIPNNTTTKPTATNSIAEANAVMKSLNWGLYLKGISSITATITGTAKYGASISRYSTTYPDGTTSLSGSSITTPALYTSGNIVSNVTDSRGFTSANVSKSFTLTDYSSPTSTISVERDKTTTTNAVVTYSSNVYYISGKNSKTLILKYKKKTESTWTSVALTSNYTLNAAKTMYVASGTTTITVSDDYQYDFQLVASDSIYNSSNTSYGEITSSAELGTSFSLMDFNADGKGIAFGKASEQDGVEFGTGMPIYIGNIKILWWED